MNKSYINSGRTGQKLKTRKKILLGAQHFISKGEDFSLEDVAEHINMSRATIYRYYSSTKVLSHEAALDLSTESPEIIHNNLKHLDLIDMLIGIQDYYNHLTLNNESAFRQFISVAITSKSPELKRAARRKQSLHLAFAENQTTLNLNEIDKLVNLLTVLMGAEAIIVSKDVCKLNDEDSCELLNWGLKLIMKGLSVK